MVLPRRIRPLTETELQDLSADRLREYRKQALCLENTLAQSDYVGMADSLDADYIWFKDDPRWKSLYDLIIAELHRKQQKACE